MNSFRFVHAADLHLGSPFRGLSARNKELSSLLKDASYRALSNLVSLCRAERAEFLLLAGDLFDQKDRSLRAQLFLREALLELDRAGVRTFVVHGNHDPLSGDRGTLSWPSSTKVFGPLLEEVTVEKNGEVIARIQGISYEKEQVTENLSRRFSRRGEEFTVGLLHANLNGNSAHKNYSPCNIADLAEPELDYWALGHVHSQQEMVLPSGTLAVYPGNLQGRHILEDGPKGCAVVDVVDGRAKVRFAALDAVRFHRLSLSIDGQKTLDGLEIALEEMLDLRLSGRVSAHAVRVTLEGRGPLHTELTPARVSEWEESLSERLSHRDPPVLLEAIKRRTQPRTSLEALVSAGGLPSAVWAEALRLAKNPEAQKTLLSEEPFQKLSSALRRAGITAEVGIPETEFLRAGNVALELLSSEEAQ